MALTPLFAGDGSAAGPTSADIDVVAIDANTAGNSARIVGVTEECVSTTIGQSVDIDIVIPSPGIPADRGMAAYQFSILYDHTVVWIDADDSDMLLAQATGSNAIPIADPKPDRNGVYQSWGVDFGPAGIEPAGASETGPGVIARITLLPQSAGISTLTLSNVLVIDDASERIIPDSVQSAIIHVGEPCSGQSQNTIPSPDSGDSDDSDVAEATSPPAPATPTPAAVALSPSPESPVEVPNGGGPPPPAGGASAGFVVFGLIAALGGATLLGKTLRR